MVSGAGRRVTPRSDSARFGPGHRCLRVESVGGAAGGIGDQRRSPSPARVAGSAQSSASTRPRSSRDRHAVSRTSRVARHSESAPVGQSRQGVRHLGARALERSRGGVRRGSGSRDGPAPPGRRSRGLARRQGPRGRRARPAPTRPGGGHPGLGGRRGRLELLQGTQLLDALGVGDVVVEDGQIGQPVVQLSGRHGRRAYGSRVPGSRTLEHVFDSSSTRVRAEGLVHSCCEVCPRVGAAAVTRPPPTRHSP